MVTKSLSCSVNGTVVGKIEYNSDAISDAIAEAIEGRDKLGLKISHMGKACFDGNYVIELRKTDTPEHFKCLAAEAKALGWC
jgi:hypothetical protein